jgi:1,4-dihydroxy-2-naphthoate octaprenyltransferase
VNTVKVWLRELRAPFFTGTVMPTVFGAAYARYAGAEFNWPLFGLTLLGAVLTHAGLNMANDYFDHKSGNDDLTPATPVSGGSKVIQERLLAPGQVLTAAIGCLAAGAGIGLYLVFRLTPVGARLALLAVGLVGMVIAWFYEAPPFKFGHRSGLGEAVCVLGCGPVVAFGAYLVQARHVAWPALVVGLPVGMLMGLVLFINEFHDVYADRAVGKRTLVVALGTSAASMILAVVLFLTYALTVALVVARVLPVLALLTLATVPLAWFAFARCRKYHDQSPKLLPANFAIIGLHFLFATILIITVVF